MGHAYVNAAAEAMLGYTREELLHVSFLDAATPISATWSRSEAWRVIRGEDPTA